jgi:hypothetical protein
MVETQYKIDGALGRQPEGWLYQSAAGGKSLAQPFKAGWPSNKAKSL